MEEKLLEIKYSMTLDEISDGFMQFWKKYQLKRTIIFSAVYVIALILGADMIIRNSSNFYGYVIVGLAAGMTFYSWYKPFQIRNKMLSTLSSLAEETYITEIYPSELRITTHIVDETEDENAEASEGDDGQTESPPEQAETEPQAEELENAVPAEDYEVSVYRFGMDLMDATETEDTFLLFVNKRLIYIYPKRCLSDDEQDKLREILKDKAIL
ncbi:MAG: YcxB family protein [Eubacterium sp.]|nr:YcxB family protein [Eubacterium sp.]